ncbi:hypothetical protein Saro_3131 [Novosphingobium aromaticivorans DSM 12444]|uniref:NlpC/P60 domain-containing protein n=1 Tax=Novosphingobium aromaticivorans (strain ATCC 700278 / DSM 12444 / CCUG 56034 / CIP 105152 / NBRC 16084 / F199) TaxID=279238 RepID=Q2G3K7_NOVAD|nr:hypothetical protein [Novosphingobium aromaticivorans]ABD27566.1 hypothetical protein Saro_3131 [Novosphingobium aromaticivorans DSM 12444]SCY71636.1 hypothetical protein SAMN05660666_02650 [Novosphingobium aromaticivorans]
MNEDLAKAALTLVGAPFRLHGRDVSTGLDCIGVVAEAMRLTGRAPDVPEGYSLRAVSLARWIGHARRSGLVEADRDGDVVLCMTSPIQPHLLVTAPGGFVHAHASLGRVTFLPGAIPWPVARHWRLLSKEC